MSEKQKYKVLKYFSDVIYSLLETQGFYFIFNYLFATTEFYVIENFHVNERRENYSISRGLCSFQRN